MNLRIVKSHSSDSARINMVAPIQHHRSTKMVIIKVFQLPNTVLGKLV